MTTKNNPPEYSRELMEESKKLAGKYANQNQICPCEYCKQHSDNYQTILRALEAAEARIHEGEPGWIDDEKVYECSCGGRTFECIDCGQCYYGQPPAQSPMSPATSVKGGDSKEGGGDTV